MRVCPFYSCQFRLVNIVAPYMPPCPLLLLVFDRCYNNWHLNLVIEQSPKKGRVKLSFNWAVRCGHCIYLRIGGSENEATKNKQVFFFSFPPLQVPMQQLRKWILLRLSVVDATLVVSYSNICCWSSSCCCCCSFCCCC